MLKQVQFKGIDERGQINCQPLFSSALEKTAEVLEMRSKLHPRVQDFVRTVRPTPAGIYVLVNALGAGEYWGSNVNGDFFPEKALIHAPSNWEDLLSTPDQARQVGQSWPYGFPTFMGAHPYKHHVNKDPSRAFGRVELSTWNPKMHRVELVVYLDRALCMQFDAMDVIDRIERGEFPDVSMGCKVPFDVCSICQNQSKTRADYCQHALMQMNKILPDGRKVYVINTLPKFFDISFVFIGADKTAKVMAKLAQVGNRVCMGDFCTMPKMSAEVGEIFTKVADPEDEIRDAPVISKEVAQQNSAVAMKPFLKTRQPEIVKTASCDCHGLGDDCGGSIDKLAEAIFPLSKAKSASQQKLSEIIKSIPAGPFTKETLPRLERSEQDIPNNVLDTMGSLPLSSALSTPSMAGMVLKPREFQRIILIRIGENQLANDLDNKGVTFGRTSEVDDSIPVNESSVNDPLMDVFRILGLIGSRSAAAPALRSRAASAPADQPFHPIGSSDSSVLMNKIAAAYNGYRRNILKKAASIADYMTTNPQLRSDLFGSSMAQAFAGGVSKVASASILSPESLAYLVGAYTDRDIHLTNEVVMSLAHSGAVSLTT